MTTADQFLNNWQFLKSWFYIGVAIVGLFLVRQFWRLTDKACDSALAKISKGVREAREQRRKERQEQIEKLRANPEARQLWGLREMRFRLELIANMVTGGILLLVGPASTFLLVVLSLGKVTILFKTTCFLLGAVCAYGVLMIFDAWVGWWFNANDMRDILKEATKKP